MRNEIVLMNSNFWEVTTNMTVLFVNRTKYGARTAVEIVWQATLIILRCSRNWSVMEMARLFLEKNSNKCSSSKCSFQMLSSPKCNYLSINLEQTPIIINHNSRLMPDYYNNLMIRRKESRLMAHIWTRVTWQKCGRITSILETLRITTALAIRDHLISEPKKACNIRIRWVVSNNSYQATCEVKCRHLRQSPPVQVLINFKINNPFTQPNLS